MTESGVLGDVAHGEVLLHHVDVEVLVLDVPDQESSVPEIILLKIIHSEQPVEELVWPGETRLEEARNVDIGLLGGMCLEHCTKVLSDSAKKL